MFVNTRNLFATLLMFVLYCIHWQNSSTPLGSRLIDSDDASSQIGYIFKPNKSFHITWWKQLIWFHNEKTNSLKVKTATLWFGACFKPQLCHGSSPTYQRTLSNLGCKNFVLTTRKILLLTQKYLSNWSLPLDYACASEVSYLHKIMICVRT